MPMDSAALDQLSRMSVFEELAVGTEPKAWMEQLASEGSSSSDSEMAALFDQRVDESGIGVRRDRVFGGIVAEVADKSSVQEELLEQLARFCNDEELGGLF